MRTLFTLLGACLSAGPALAQQPTDYQPTLPRPRTSTTMNSSPAAAAAAKLPTNPRSRISRQLQQLYSYSNGAGATSANPRSSANMLSSGAALREAFPNLSVQDNGGPATVLVRITAENVAALRPLLEARGFQTVSAKGGLHFIEGELPVSQLAPGKDGITALAARGLLGVTAVWQPITHIGRVQNQADYLLESYRVRGTTGGFNGQGQRIGVMSDSYNSLGGAAAGVASGDLPANVQVLQDLPAGRGSDEGRAMIELIRDIAPGAGIAFSSVFRGEADFADQMLRLADPTLGNCKILVDDVGYFAAPMFQDGVVAQAVNEASNRLGITYFGSAGNAADASSEYVSPVFRARTGPAGTPSELDFGASFTAGGASDTRQRFSIPKAGTLVLSLQWSDPFYTTRGVRTDLDMYLVKARAGGAVQRGDTVAVSDDNNLASQTPAEIFGYVNNNDTDTEFDLVVTRRAGTANPARVKYISYGDNITPVNYFTRSSTLTGHHAAERCMAVAAAPSYNRLAPEGFTAKGRPTILFTADGNPLAAPDVREKPEFTAVDGVSTTFFAGGAVPDPNDGFLFFGTSAAAPNAAAVAALLLQAQPTFTPTQVRTRLQTTALDLGPAGFDDRTGAGLINAYRAIFGPVVAATAPFTETFDVTGLSTAWDIQGRGPVRAFVRSDFGPASTPGHLVLDGFFPYFNFRDYPSGPNGPRVAEATLRLNLSAAIAGGYVLNFKQKKFAGEVDNAMPATYANNSPGSISDGVALSVDGGQNWFRLADLTGTNSTTTYQTVSVNLNTFATANNLTLGADVRIRFQRSGSGQVDSSLPNFRGGRAFDDVLVNGANAVQAPVAQFGVSNGGPLCPGSSVQYRDASLFAGTGTTYAWTFPGGTPATSTDANPVVGYTAAGTYGATLTVTNANGTSTRTTAALVTISTIVPTANFTVARQAPICPGGRVAFRNASSNCVSTLAWSFPGGTPATSTDANPVITYAAAGTYTASLVASNANGSSAPRTFTVVVQGPAAAIPFAESFASGIPAVWSVLNPDNGLTWTSAPNTLRKDGTRGTVAVMPFGPYPAKNQRDSLQSPALNLSGPAAFLRFDIAYAPVTGANDSLGVNVFRACTNAPLGQVYLKSAATGLGTTLPRDNTVYTPSSPSQWRTEIVNLSAFLGQQVYLRFIAYNQYGNNLYLANVQLDAVQPLAVRTLVDSPTLQVYPNPLGGGATLNLTLPKAPGQATLRVVDAVGRLCSQTNVALSAGASTSTTLRSPVAAGLYTVLCQTADGQLFSRRFVVE